MNFWSKLEKPILCLAPMADVTDSAFRHIIAKYSKKITPHQKSQGEPLTYVTYTEFVSADGLALAPEEGRKKLLKDLEYTEIERPIVAQFFTSRPENMEQAARLAAKLGFDGVDINMGCPDKSIEKQGAGAALIKNPRLARELIRAAKRGTEGEIPVSVKTRLGYNKDELEESASLGSEGVPSGWLYELLAEDPAAIILHARTRKEMSLVPARWNRVRRAVEIRDSVSSKTLILGNGDVQNVEEAQRLAEDSGVDGVMLGRAVFGNPFLFSNYRPNLKEKLEVLKEHIQLFDKNLGGTKSFAVMKKHFKSYLSREVLIEWDPHVMKDLRVKLMEAQSVNEVIEIVNKFLALYN